MRRMQRQSLRKKGSLREGKILRVASISSSSATSSPSGTPPSSRNSSMSSRNSLSQTSSYHKSFVSNGSDDGVCLLTCRVSCFHLMATYDCSRMNLCRIMIVVHHRPHPLDINRWFTRCRPLLVWIPTLVQLWVERCQVQAQWANLINHTSICQLLTQECELRLLQPLPWWTWWTIIAHPMYHPMSHHHLACTPIRVDMLMTIDYTRHTLNQPSTTQTISQWICLTNEY